MRACAFSPDARLVISASDDQRVRLWDVETGKLQHVLEGPDDYVCSLAVSRSGRQGRSMLAASDSDCIWVCELYTGRVLRVLKVAAGASEAAEGTEDHKKETSENLHVSISMMQDGTKLAAATRTEVVVWDVPSFEEPVWEDNGEEPCRCVLFSNNNHFLASTAGAVITIRNAKTGKVLRRLPEPGPLSPDARTKGLMARSGDGASVNGTPEPQQHRAPTDEVDVEPQVETPDCKEGHSASIDGLAFSPDKYLASGSDDATA